MSKILEIQKQLSKFKLDVETRKSAKANSEKLTNLNRVQMREGKDAFGFMNDYRAEWYADVKRQLPTYDAPFPKRDLYFTGKFQRAMYLVVSGDFFTFNSRDSKTPDILNREGIEIFELNKENMSEARNIVQSDLRRKILKIFS